MPSTAPPLPEPSAAGPVWVSPVAVGGVCGPAVLVVPNGRAVTGSSPLSASLPRCGAGELVGAENTDPPQRQVVGNLKRSWPGCRIDRIAFVETVSGSHAGCR